MAIPDNQKLTAEVQIEGQIASEGASARPWLSIFHLRRANPTLPISKANLASAFITHYAVPLQALLNNTWTATTVRVRIMEDVTDPFIDTSILGGWVGGVAGDRLPPDNIAFFNVKTALRGGTFRGRKFWSPMSESDTTAGTTDLWNAAALLRLGAVATSYATTITDADGNVWAPQVVSRTLSSNKPVPALIIATPIVSVAVRKSIGRFKKREPSRVY